MQTRSQKFASRAWEALATRQRPGFDKAKYGGMAHKLPTLIRTCGLVQALTFVAARKEGEALHLLEDLAATLDLSLQELLNQSRTAPILDYLRLTEQCLESLLWFKRFAESELDVYGPTEKNELPVPTGGLE